MQNLRILWFDEKFLTYSVDVSLIQKDEKDNIISEASNSIHSWHLDDKSKNVINKGIQSLVSHHSPWQMSDGFQLVIDEQLGGHHDEAESQQESICTAQDETVPAGVFIVNHARKKNPILVQFHEKKNAEKFTNWILRTCRYSNKWLEENKPSPSIWKPCDQIL